MSRSLLQRQTLQERIRQSIVDAILGDEIQPGQQISTRALASILEVSLTPVREALRELAGEGVVEILPNGTALVPELTPATLRQLMWIERTLVGAMIEDVMASPAGRTILSGLFAGDQSATHGGRAAAFASTIADATSLAEVRDQFNRVRLRMGCLALRAREAPNKKSADKFLKAGSAALRANDATSLLAAHAAYHQHLEAEMLHALDKKRGRT